MNDLERIELLFAEVATENALPPFEFDDDGRTAVDIGDGYLFIEADPAAIRLSATLGRVAPEAKAAVYERLLEANLFGGDTLGSFFALNGATGEPVLERELATERLDAAKLAQGLENFLSLAAAWRERIGKIAEAALEAAAAMEDAEADDVDGIDIEDDEDPPDSPGMMIFQ